MAMVGIIVVSILVYKKSSTINLGNKSTLKIDDKIALNARKSLYVVNAGGERFLIAGDIDNTSLIAKLGQDKVTELTSSHNPIKFLENVDTPTENKKSFISNEHRQISLPVFKTELSQADKALNESFEKIDTIKFNKYLDVKNIRKKPVMKELARKLAQI